MGTGHLKRAYDQVADYRLGPGERVNALSLAIVLQCL